MYRYHFVLAAKYSRRSAAAAAVGIEVQENVDALTTRRYLVLVQAQRRDCELEPFLHYTPAPASSFPLWAAACLA
jgi:hypothetical protein